MADRSSKALRQEASLALRSGEWDTALACYTQLEANDPTNPVWPQRCADIYGERGQTTLEIAALDRAAEAAVEVGDIILAIAFCKQILTCDPNHLITLDRIHLLYATPIPRPGPSDPPNTAAPIIVSADPDSSHIVSPSSAPLDELLLTEMLPNATPDISSNPEESGIAEIHLTEVTPSDTTRGGGSGSRIGSAREQLLSTPLFGSLDADSLRFLIGHVRLVRLSEGEVLFRQGDPADCLYVVADGAVVPIAEEGERKKLAVLEPGSFFGEIGLMTNAPRNSTIEAMVDSRVLAIDRATMWELIRRRPEVLEVMVSFLRDRLVDRLIRTNPLFLAFPSGQRPAVAKLFRFLEVRKGTTLIDQGRPAQSLFALLAGTAQVIQMNFDCDKVLAELTPGSIVGEMSLLNQSPAVAAVVTSSKCWVLALSRDRLTRLIESNPEAEEIIKNLAHHRKTQNEREAVSPVARAGPGGGREE